MWDGAASTVCGVCVRIDWLKASVKVMEEFNAEFKTKIRHSCLFLIQAVPAACSEPHNSQIIIHFGGKQPPLWLICHNVVLFPWIWGHGRSGYVLQEALILCLGIFCRKSRLLFNVVMVSLCWLLTKELTLTGDLLFLAPLSLETEKSFSFFFSISRVICIFSANVRVCVPNLLTKIAVGRK